MADNWNLRGKTQMLDDLNTPSLQCRVYDRIAVQDSKGKTHFTVWSFQRVIPLILVSAEKRMSHHYCVM